MGNGPHGCRVGHTAWLTLTSSLTLKRQLSSSGHLPTEWFLSPDSTCVPGSRMHDRSVESLFYKIAPKQSAGRLQSLRSQESDTM